MHEVNHDHITDRTICHAFWKRKSRTPKNPKLTPSLILPCDKNVLTPYVYPSWLPEDDIRRQILSIFLITSLGGALLYLVTASLSYHVHFRQATYASPSISEESSSTGNPVHSKVHSRNVSFNKYCISVRGAWLLEAVQRSGQLGGLLGIGCQCCYVSHVYRLPHILDPPLSASSNDLQTYTQTSS